MMHKVRKIPPDPQNFTARAAPLRRAKELERAKQALLDNMVDGVTLLGPAGEPVAANPAASRLLGLSAAQLAGLSPPGPGWSAVGADGRHWASPEWPSAETLRTGIERHDEIMQVSPGDGPPRWLCLNTVIVRGASGTPEGVVTTYADVTGTRAKEVRLAGERQASRERVESALSGQGDRLSVAYQPIVELLSGAVVGFEALSRFVSEPLRPPDEWFAEAATVGLGIELELHALSAALAGLNRMPEAMYLSVNVSPATAMSPGLFELLAGSPCERIVLEVTEHVGVEDYTALSGCLERLRGRGLRVAIDDAGAGYASLRHILNMRPDIIKLDIGLTRGIDTDPASQALAIALVSFREEIGAVLVAEGIETQHEVDTLVRLGLRHGQGYHLGRPGDLPPARPASQALPRPRTLVTQAPRARAALVLDLQAVKPGLEVVQHTTERAHASQAWAVSEERLRSTFDGSPAGLAIVSLEPGDRGQLLQVNPSLCDMTGFGAGQLLQMRLTDVFSTVEGGTGPAGRAVTELLDTDVRRLCRCTRADSSVAWAQLGVAELAGQPRRCLVQVDDVTAQKLAEEELAYRALHDSLTGLPNRHLAMDHLRLALKQLSRNEGAVAVLYIDLDLFKRVNDTLGHEAGDEVLRQVGARLAHAVRAPDTAARLGGDEFIVICTVPGEDGAKRVVERVQAALNRPVAVAGQPLDVSASIGVTVTTGASARADDLLREADSALYEAKHRGGPRWHSCSVGEDR
jgi:diguanylate cyclase (GGDEF)-like protein/PAS domain S-box-containing protein